MSTNTLGTKNPGDIVSSDDPNQYKSALGVDVVPRNVSGVPQNIAGSLGSTLYSWLSAYIKKVYIGIPADDFTVEGTSATIFMKLVGAIKFKVDVNGVDGTYFKTGSVPLSVFDSTQRPTMRSVSFTADGSWTVPTGVTEIIPEGCSGGGGGGGAGGGNGSGGAGGAGAVLVHGPSLTVTPGEVLTIDVGALGAKGLGANQGGITAGHDGSVSRILRGATVIWTTTEKPGGGQPGVTSSNTTVNGPTAAAYLFPGTNGGNGGRGNPGGDGTAGTPGNTRIFLDNNVGGSPGAGAIGGGGGGGGGGAGIDGNGGNGGAANTTGANGQDGQGHGAGGGGGGGSKDGGSGGTGTGGNGGDGGGGLVKILWSGGST